MAIKFWVPCASLSLTQAGSTTALDPAPVNKASSDDAAVDETDRVAIHAWWGWRLTAAMQAVNAAHGGITKVTLHARAYISNIGVTGWYPDSTANNRPFIAPRITVNGTTTYSLPEWISYTGWSNPVAAFSWGTNYVGYDLYDTFKNWNQPGEPAARKIAWDITALAPGGGWTNELLAAAQIGLSNDGQALSANTFSGVNASPRPEGNSPQYNVSQLILEVDAADPPPAAAAYARCIIAVMG